MKAFLLVYRTQLFSALGAGKAERKRGAARVIKLSGYIALWLLIAAFAGAYEFLYASVFASFGKVDSFPALIVFASSLLTLFTSISYTKSLIFRSKDHDLLFSLPIKNSTIIAAKLATIYTLDLAMSLALLLPCGIAYGMMGAPSAATLVRFFILVLFVPMLPILLGAILSALVSLIAARFRFSKFIGTVLYIVLFAAYMAFVFGVGGMGEDAEIMAMFMGLSEKFKTVYPPVAWFEGAFLGDLVSLLLFLGVSAVALLLVVAVFGKFYGKIHDAFSVSVSGGKYKVSSASADPAKALLKKEWQRFLAVPGVMINQAAGLLMLLLYVGFMIYKLLSGGETDGAVTLLLTTVAPYFFALCTAMSDVSASSFSLEGKSLWILKALPLSPWEIIKTKLRLHLLICFPLPVVCGIVLSLVLGMALPETALLLLLPLIYSYNAGTMGLLLNLKKPKLDFVSEMVVAKQSFAVTVTLFAGMFAAMIPAVAAILAAVLFGEMGRILSLAVGGTTAILGILLGIILTSLLKKKGDGLFYKLGE